MLIEIECCIKNLSIKEVNEIFLIEQISIVNSKLPNKKGKKELLKILIERLIKAIQGKQLNDIRGLVRVIFLCEFQDTIIQTKKMGVFRASRYSYEDKAIKWVIKEVQSLDALKNDEDLNKYLNNVGNLLNIAPEVRSDYHKILDAMKSKKYFYKTLLALGELIYIDFHNNSVDYLCENTSDKKFAKNKEAIIEAISLISELYQDDIGIDKKDFVFIDQNFNFSYYWELVYKGHKLFTYKQTEIQIDYFSLEVVEKDSRNIFLMDDNNFEKSKANGYYKHDIKHLALTVDHVRDANPDSSIQDYFERLFETLSDKFNLRLYEVKNDPIPRIVIAIPDFSESGLEIMQIADLFEDDLLYLKILCNDNYNDEILDKKVFKELSILDVIKIKRIFDFISFLYVKGIEELAHNNIVLALSSILPVFEYPKLIKLVEVFSGLSYKKCEDLINYLSLDLSKINHSTDLQYQPIIRLENQCMVLSSVLSKSNIIRSMAIQNNIHLSSFDSHDYMMDTVKKSFLLQGFQVVMDFNFAQDEADIVAYKDGQLFIFECKNPYHPTNIYELRNTYGHIKKGFSQLEKFKKILSNIEKRERFITNTGFESVVIEDIHFGLINANRALASYTEGDFTVYHANEVIKFITDGKIRFMDDEYLTWNSEIFKVQDLIDYMNGKVSKDIFYALEKHSYFINYRSAQLETPVYILNENLLASTIIENYTSLA